MAPAGFKEACSVSGCEKRPVARRLCNKHWKRWRKHGAAEHTPHTEKSVRERLMERVSVKGPNECWEWKGSTRGRPGMRYGIMSVNGKNRTVHRISYELANGVIGKEIEYRQKCVCHTCDNPLCVNPRHLFIGSHLRNMQDKSAKGRSPNKQKTHCKRGHEYTEQNTYVCRRGIRNCRECHRIRQRENRRKKRVKESSHFSLN